MPLQRRTLISAASGLTVLSRRPRAEIAADTVKVGVLGDQTTFGADAGGVGSVIAARMATEDFGGRAGGRPVEVVAADFGDRPDVAATTARRWFDREGVHAIADMTLSSAALAVQGIARERGRTLLIAGAATSDLTGKACSPFSTHWADDTHVIATNVARGLLETGQDTWFFISPDYALGAALERDATAAITAGGGRRADCRPRVAPGARDGFQLAPAARPGLAREGHRADQRRHQHGEPDQAGAGVRRRCQGAEAGGVP